MSLGLPNNKDLPVLAEITPCVQDHTAGLTAPCQPGAPAPAKDAGLQPGDEVTSIAGKPISTWSEMLTITRELSGPTEFKVLRDGKELTLTVNVPKVTREVTDGKGGREVKEVGAIGVTWQQNFEYSPLAAVPASFAFTGDMFVNTWKGLMRFPERIPAVVEAIGGGERDPETPISVVGASSSAATPRSRACGRSSSSAGGAELLRRRVQPAAAAAARRWPHRGHPLREDARLVRKLRGKVAGAPVNYMR